MFALLSNEAAEKKFNDHFAHVDRASPFWDKIQPMETSERQKYVVRTFNDSLTEGDRTLPLPYDLVTSHPSQDIWGFGNVAYVLLTGQSLVSVNRDEDVAGPESMLQAATWTDTTIKEHLIKRKHLIKDDNALDLLVKLLRVKPGDRFQNMADVLCHPFFEANHGHHGSAEEKDSDFVQFAKSNSIVRLDETAVIKEETWRFRRADLAMTGSISSTSFNKSSEREITIELEKLFGLTKIVLSDSIQKTHALAPPVRCELQRMVQEVTKQYDEVQNSILNNLVISQERAPAEAFNAMFPIFKGAVEAQFPKKPPQTKSTPLQLFGQAARVKESFKQV